MTRRPPAIWPLRGLDRRAGPGERCSRACIFTKRSHFQEALAGGQQVVPSLARLEQFRRRLGMPAGVNATAQIETLDRLSQQNHGEPGSRRPPQFVERCSLITYASSAARPRTAAPGQAGRDRRLRGFSMALSRRLAHCQVDQGRPHDRHYYTHLDGFDTHSGQLQRRLLRALDGRSRRFSRIWINP